MPLNIVVPELGESIVDARVAKWLKQKGDRVEVGDALVELETDKINLEVPAPGKGVLESIARPDGADVKIGEVLGTIAEQAAEAPPDGVAAAAAVQPRATPPPSTPARESPSARRAAREREKAAADEKRTERSAEPAETPPPPGGDKTAAGSDAPPTGSDARPTVPQTVIERPTVVARPVESGSRREERIRMSKRRATIASRLVQAQHTAAMLSTFNEADMTGVMELRERHKAGFTEKHGASIGITTFFVKAAVVALAEFPRLNAEVQGDEMVLKHYFDIGVAVGAPEGLVVPVVHNADQLSFAEINLQIRDLAQKATKGTLTLDDLRGGTFSITNGGVYGSLLSTPILNPPQVGILGMHAIQRRPVDVNGQIVSKPMMYLALTYDHRIVDGEEAVRFLVRIKQLVEDPGRLLIES